MLGFESFIHSLSQTIVAKHLLLCASYHYSAGNRAATQVRQGTCPWELTFQWEAISKQGINPDTRQFVTWTIPVKKTKQKGGE